MSDLPSLRSCWPEWDAYVGDEEQQGGSIILGNNAEGFEAHELLTRITPTSIQFKRKGALSDMKESREKAGTITNPGVDLLLRLCPQPVINNPLHTEWKRRPKIELKAMH